MHFIKKLSLKVATVSLIVAMIAMSFPKEANAFVGDRWDPCTCTRYNSDGTTDTAATCDDPQPNGACDTIKSCKYMEPTIQ